MLGVLFHQILAILPVSFNEFVMGIGYGWTSPILNRLREKKHYSIEELAWIGSIHEFGRIIGPSMGAILLDRIGRKNILILCSITFFVSWTCIAFTSTIFYIYLARLLFGIGNGMNDVASSIYVGENYSAKARGIFCNVVIACFCGAELVEFVVASMLSYETIAYMNLILTLVGLVTTIFLVETPQYLLMKNKPNKARRNFEYLRGVNQISDEFTKIEENIEEQKKMENFSYKELFTIPANLKSLTVIFILNIFTMGTGYAAITSYMTLMFSNSEKLTPYQLTILFGVIQLISSVSLTLYIEKFNRRTLIILCFAVTCVVHFASAGLLYVHQNVAPVQHFSWWIFATITTYGAVYAVLFPVVHIIRGELFPQSIKAVGGFIAITVHSSMAFVTSRAFLNVENSYGTYVNFLFFGIMSFMSLIYNYFKLPETRGKMLVDIHNSLGKC